MSRRLVSGCHVLASPAFTAAEDQMMMAAMREADPELMRHVDLDEYDPVTGDRFWRQPPDDELAIRVHELSHKAYTLIREHVECEMVCEEIPEESHATH
jgi:hypothetical protein